MNAEQEEILRNNIRQLIEVVKQKKTNEQKHMRALAMQEHTWEMRVDKILGHIENDLPSK